METDRKGYVRRVDGALVSVDHIAHLYAAQNGRFTFADRSIARTLWRAIKAKMPSLKPRFHRKDRGFNGHYAR